METKLTLKLDEAVIASAKQLAKAQNRSLSRLVEDYFRNLMQVKERRAPYSPLIEELSGILSERDVKEGDYQAYLERKYE